MTEQLGLPDAERVGLAIAAALGGDSSLAALRRRPSGEVFAAARQALPHHYHSAVVDGIALTMTPAAYYRRHGVPADLLVGSNENEGWMGADDDPAKLAAALEALPPPARELFAARAAREADARHGHDAVVTLSAFVCPAYALAAAATAAGYRAWVYRFTRVRPGPGGRALRAYHAAELPYVFDTHDPWYSHDAADERLSAAMLAYWSNFARDGDPNGSGLEAWPAFDAADARVQELGAEIGPRPAPERALCERAAASLYPGWSP